MISGCQRYIDEVRDVGTFIRDARDARDARTRVRIIPTRVLRVDTTVSIILYSLIPGISLVLGILSRNYIYKENNNVRIPGVTLYFQQIFVRLCY